MVVRRRRGGPPASHGSTNLEKAPPKCTPEPGFGGKSLRRRSAGAGPTPRSPTSHGRIGVPHAIRTQGTAPLPHAASELGRPSELQYISTNSFGGPVALSKIPCGPVAFSGGSRAKSSFSAGILNTIEEVRARSAKVTCFTVENGPPSRPPRNWQRYRGFDHLGRWGP